MRRLSNQSVLLVFCCTLIGAAAQIFMKTGANRLNQQNLVDIVIATVTNLPLLFGYCLYGMSTMFLVLALRKGQLSLLYPIISLTYVWVTILSMLIFHESMNPFKAVGLTIVVAGVAVLGMDTRK
ncbi:MAG: EamA family transporter [Bryobacteraceae bacterium]